ncbi:hypothetical protein [Streptomyces sp. NPDC014764]|uniref:hypothetical protein n=1 Tax=Streptomyces sp. NPDC014764 TaxID=3364907 RepID=UPI0036FD6B2D
MLQKMRVRQRHNRLMRVADHLVRDAAVISSEVASLVTAAQVACLAFARYQLPITEEEAADYLAAALVARGHSTDHQLAAVTDGYLAAAPVARGRSADQRSATAG